jgi:NADH:ubiquinone reductase (non-electrogenic)
MRRQYSQITKVILGAGWAGFRLIKDIDLSKYNVHVVAPRNHFLFTPLLASAASGTLEFR